MIKLFGRNKKGNITDIPYIAGMLFILALTIIVGYVLLSDLNIEINNNDKISTEAKEAHNTVLSKYLIFDYAYLIVWAVALLGTFISSYFIRTSPVFFVFFLISLVIILAALIPVNNLMQEVFGADDFAAAVDSFPIIMFYISHFFKIVTIHGFVVGYILYSKVSQ